MGNKSKRPGTEIHQELRKIRRKRSWKSSCICSSSVIIQKSKFLPGVEIHTRLFLIIFTYAKLNNTVKIQKIDFLTVQYQICSTIRCSMPLSSLFYFSAKEGSTEEILQ